MRLRISAVAAGSLRNRAEHRLTEDGKKHEGETARVLVAADQALCLAERGDIGHQSLKRRAVGGFVAGGLSSRDSI